MPDENEGADQKQRADTNSKPIDQSVAPSPATDHIRSDSAKSSEPEKRPTDYDFRKWNLRFTGALVFIGAAYSFFSYQQWQVMNGQLAMTHLDQRAWVAPFAIEGKPEEGKPYNVSIVIKNTGKTFALETRVMAAFERHQLSDPIPDFDVELDKLAKIRRVEMSNSIGLLPPNGTFTTTVELSDKRNLTKEDMLTVTDPTQIIYVFGKTTYKDIFNCEHWSKFSVHCVSDGTIRNFGKYGNADNNCGPERK
jgi:hypothetical protein